MKIGFSKKLIVFVVIIALVVVGFFLYKDKLRPVSPDGALKANYVEVDDGLVDGFPKIPIFPGATIEKSRKIDNGKGYSALLEIDAGKNSVSRITEWYQSELKKGGWIVEPELPENIADVERTIKASKEGKILIMGIEQGEGDDPDIVEILLNIS